MIIGEIIAFLRLGISVVHDICFWKVLSTAGLDK
jgi:hypothetical protein